MVQPSTSISGKAYGKKANIVPAAKSKYDALSNSARSGSYWAKMAIEYIHGLSSGRLSKDNIFVRSRPMVAQGGEEFVLFLPGCRAVLERRENELYYLIDLAMDTSYSENKSLNLTTGLHKAERSKSSSVWATRFYKSGYSDVVNKELRIVAITDGGYAGATQAVNVIAASIAKAPDAPSWSNFGVMDVHYTNSPHKNGGLLRFNTARKPLHNQAIYGSAILLAESMIGVKDKQVTWVSERGGSAVLTQALKIVADKNVQLTDHNIFLFDPTTPAKTAMQMVRSAGIKPDRNAVYTGIFNVMGNAG